MRHLITLALVVTVLGVAAGQTLAAIFDPPPVQVNGTEGPDVRAKVPPKAIEGPDIRNALASRVPAGPGTR